MHEAARRHLIAEIAEGTARCAKRINCKRCGAPCLRGDDYDDCALVATVDEEPVDRLGEMFAVLDGRTTYDLVRATGKTAKAGTHHLWIRYPHHLDSPRVYGTIHVEHRCRTEPPK